MKISTNAYRVLCVTNESDLPETELFIRLKKAGIDMEVACNPKGRYFDRLKASEVPIHELVTTSRFSMQSIRKIRLLLSRRHYDILYCFNNKATSNVLLATRGENYRIMTYRGTVGNISFLSPSSWTTHLNPRVDRIVCVSNAVREYLLAMRFLGLCLRPERAVTIYKGHDLSWYQSKPINLSAEFKLPENAFVVGFAGKNRPLKGVNFLVDAARHLPGKAPIYFLLIGDRLRENRSLHQQIASSPYADRIYLTGFRSDAPAIIGACDAFIMPSIKREGLSKAVIEAMSYATTPIVTEAGGLPELVENGHSGIVTPPCNARAIAAAIMQLYENPIKTREMGENARERIRNIFNIDKTVEQTRQLFEQLVASDQKTVLPVDWRIANAPRIISQA